MNQKPNYKIAIEYITPSIASGYLETNPNNRNLRWSVVERYARDMKRGNWQDNGGTILIYDDGTLKDGQHRLTAIVESGEAQWMVVIRNIPKESTICDTGARRTVRDIMALEKADTALRNMTMISVCRLLYYMETRSTSLTESDVIDMMKANADAIVATYELTASSHNELTCSRHFATAIFVAITAGVPIPVLEEFCGIVNKGFCDDSRKYAAVVLRNYLLAKKGANIPLNVATSLFTIIIMALDDFIHGKPRQKNYTALKEPKWSANTRKDIFLKFETREGTA